MPKREKQTKPPARLEIQAHDAPSSPHVLNLRERELDLRSYTDSKDSAGQSFEEKVAAFDKRLREVPDLLKTQTENLSRFWKIRAGSFLSRAMRMGTRVEDRIAETAKQTKTYVQASRLAGAHRQSSFPHFLPILALLILITTPVQAMFVYRAVAGTRVNIASNWEDTLKHLNALKIAAGTKDLTSAHAELNGLLDNLNSMQKISSRLDAIKLFLPERFRLVNPFLRFAEQGILSLEQLASAGLDLKAGAVEPGALLRSAEQELRLLNLRLGELSRSRTAAKALAPYGTYLKDAHNLAYLLAKLFGAPEERRILLIFQNPRELRATGGFAGSFALMTARNGLIETIEAPEGGTYAIQGQLPLARIAPKPLHLINPRFEFQDANWWPDFPTSARKITELYEAAGGPTVDAVVALTAHVGEELLVLQGKTELNPAQTGESALTPDNFIDVLQETIARDRVQDPGSPKKIITSLLPSMVEVVKNTASCCYQELIKTGLSLLNRKDIQIWARDQDIQSAIAKLGWSGALKNTQGDYLAVITSNVGGGKTDQAVEEKIEQDIQIDARGIAYETVRITRTHNGQRGDKFTGHRNYAYLRIYVPTDARFLAAAGNTPPPAHTFEDPEPSLDPDPEVRKYEGGITIDPQSGAEIWEENEKTVFGLWITTEAGQTATAAVTYEVPIKSQGAAMPYTLTLDPQAGKRAQILSRITVEGPMHVLAGDQNGRWQAHGWSFEGSLETPIVASGVLYKL